MWWQGYSLKIALGMKLAEQPRQGMELQKKEW